MLSSVKYFACSKKCASHLNPFLFIHQSALLGSKCWDIINSKLPIPGFPYNLLLATCGGIGFLKNCIGHVLAWISGLKVPLLPLGPLPFANYSDEWSARVWQPAADSNCRLVWSEPNNHYTVVCSGFPHPTKHVKIYKKISNCYFGLQRAVEPDWMGTVMRLGSTALWGQTTAFFSKGRETLWGHKTAIISDEYERVKKLHKLYRNQTHQLSNLLSNLSAYPQA